jgi:hypothetical protein
VPFPVRVLDESSLPRRKASHLSIACFEFHMAIEPYGDQFYRAACESRLRALQPGCEQNERGYADSSKGASFGKSGVIVVAMSTSPK